MEKLIELLSEIIEDVDFANCKKLIDEGILDSFDIIQIVNTIDEEYGIEVPAAEIIPENFNSVEAIFEMIQKLEQE